MTRNPVQLLQELISTPSLSRQEDATASLLQSWLADNGATVERYRNNIIARCDKFSLSKPTLMLNSHHDTVKPSVAYTRDPFKPTIEDGKLYGLGSNDAGGALVALTETFLRLKDTELPFNLILALSAEEECSGINGMRHLLECIEPVDMAIVGEPTQMMCAIGERGLLVLDCITHGKSGHAARRDGINALYKAVDDINILRHLEFERVSTMMGPININVTMIECGSQHNVIPAECKYVADIRTTDAYSNEETISIIKQSLKSSEVIPRSTHIRASAIDPMHPLCRAVNALNIDTFLSPTTSDMALMPFPSIKIGPGDSARSHTADEFIYLDEINRAIETYTNLINKISL